MSVVKKCARCGLQSSHLNNRHVVCSACGTGFPLCERCVPTWKNNKCPSCGMGPANAKWQVMGGQAQSSPGLSHVGAGKSPWQIYAAGKDRRAGQRETEGPGLHHGVALDAGQVAVLREIEDAIAAEIKPVEPGKAKNNRFVARDGQVVELYLVPENQPRDGSLTAMIARLGSLEGLGIKNLGASTPLAPLAGMPGLKRLAFHSRVLDGKHIVEICDMTGLEELNIASCELDPSVLDAHLGKLVNLKKLNVRGIRSPGNERYPKNLGQLPALEEIDISNLQNLTSKPVIPSGLENLPRVKLVHMNAEQNGLGILWGKLKARLQDNNPDAYPKQGAKEKGLGFLKGLASGAQSPSDRQRDYVASLPEPLKRGWSGISF